MTAHRSVSAAVNAAIGAAPVPPTDVGAVALARQYARLIDNAEPAAKYAKALDALTAFVEVYGADDPDSGPGGALRTVREALAAHSVASDLGPKLLAALTALGLTTAGRGAKGGTGVPAIPDRLAEQRARAAARRKRSAARVD